MQSGRHSDVDVDRTSTTYSLFDDVYKCLNLGTHSRVSREVVSVGQVVISEV